jgi:hypothetical protein
MRSAAGLHDPLDRLGLLLYVSAKRLATQPLALTHLPDTDTLGNPLNGLDQINCNSLHNDSPNTQSLRSGYSTVVQRESITAFRSFASLTGTD